MRRVTHVALRQDGSLTGEVTIEFQGEDALEHRLDALNQDDAGRRKGLEDELKGWLPQGGVVTLQEAKGWESIDDSLVARFKIEIPGFASAVGKRMLSPGYFFSTLQKNMFTSQFRRYPISFPYPFAEEDELTMDLPEGYEVEEPPYRRKAGLSYAGYEISFAVEGHQLTAGRQFHLTGTQFPPDKYEELKNFFSVVQKGDDGHAVLQRGQDKNAQNLN